MKRNDLLLAILLLTTTALAYWPAYRGEFLWDDDRHVSNNPLLRSTEGLRQIWTNIGATPQYYPLTHTTFWIEWQLWRERTPGYHIDNVVLHAIASLLVVGLLKRLDIPGAWLAGFVFALHPLHVESVAWISERKNTLSIVFALASLTACPLFHPDRSRRKIAARWGISFALFLCAVLSKTITCILPAAAVVLIWWKHGRIRRRDLLPLIPFFLVSIVAAILTGRMEREVVGAEGLDWSMGFVERLLIAGRALWWYAAKVVWPGGLAFSYERWVIDTGSLLAWSFVILAIGLLAAALLGRHRLGRAPASGLLIFGGTLFPALSFFNLFPHRYSFVADHFQYHSDVALIALLCAGVMLLGQKIPAWAGAAWSCLIVGVLGVMTYTQCGIYQTPETLWRDTLAHTPTSWLAHNNLAAGIIYTTDDPARLEEAVRHLEIVKRLRSGHDRADWSMGDALAKLHRDDEARIAYARAETLYRNQIERDPQAPNSYIRLAGLYEQLNRRDEALATFAAASEARPDVAHFAERAGNGFFERGDHARAMPYLERWAALRPRRVEPRLKLADCYLLSDRAMDARRVLLEAAQSDPKNAEVQRALARMQREMISAPASRPK